MGGPTAHCQTTALYDFAGHRRRNRSGDIELEHREAEVAGSLTRTVAEIVPSHLHMHCNRMIMADPRRHELLIYDFLTHAYESILARPSGPKGEVAGENQGEGMPLWRQ
jgi:lantibiotic biosynthesis dehydratase-like protein